MTNPYGNLQSDKSQRLALGALVDGTSPSMALKQDATIAAGRLGPGSVALSIEDYLSGILPSITMFGDIYPDNSTDNAAVFNAALTSGRRYFVPPGLYRCNSALTPTSGSGLIGMQGQTKIVRGGQNFHQINFDTSAAAITDVVLSGIYLDGKVATYSNTNYHAIFAAGGNSNALSRIAIEDCEIVDTSGAGILLLTQATAAGRVRIRRNHLSNVGYHAICCQANSLGASGFNDVLIEGNEILDYSIAVVDAVGIVASRGGARIVVNNNIVLQATAAFSGSVSAQGISIEGADATVAGNVVRGCYGIGIEAGFSDRTTIGGNSVAGCTRAGIAVTGNNAVSGQVSTQVTISGNTADTCQVGIAAYVNDDIATNLTQWHEDISIVGNTCTNNSDHGIIAYACKRLLIAGNNCNFNSKSGIIVGYTGATAAIYTRANRDVFINGNMACGNNAGASASYAGIQVYASAATADSNTGTAYGVNFAHNNGSADVQAFLDNVLNPLTGTTLRTQANRWTPLRPGSWIGDASTPASSMDMYPNKLVPNVIQFAPVASSISSNPTPSMASGSYFVYTVSAAVQIQLPSNSSLYQEITITIIQGGSGGYAVTWVSGYKFNTAWSDTGNATGKISQVIFRQVAANTWLQVGTQGLYV